MTLIEVLVVISIIVVLMGILIPTIPMVMRRSQITTTESLIHRVEGAISVYHTQNGTYPTSNVVPEKRDNAFGDDGYEDELLAAKALGRNHELRSELISIDPDSWGPQGDDISDDADGDGADDTPDDYDEDLIEDLYGSGSNAVRRYDPGQSGVEFAMIIDVWGHALRYRPYVAYLDVDKAANPNSYQLWSLGPDALENGDPFAKFDSTQPVGELDYEDAEFEMGDTASAITNWRNK